ncbi:hypothetical protein [Pseudomonas sp. efr-133-TYG-103a]|uniref:hypothetical protein n=1 Tax=Pseudomonas sp. efr-133-TYG-103a TaxID=3040308 RepID=UPI002555AE55|nr:hypothetical protein [Pseudomonas sp. efr-133-TYG-103a]
MPTFDAEWVHYTRLALFQATGPNHASFVSSSLQTNATLAPSGSTGSTLAQTEGASADYFWKNRYFSDNGQGRNFLPLIGFEN